jgi:AAA15 family ATPase/GTPase
MKLNKEQRLALVTRIKQLAKEEQNKFVEQVEKAWMPSDNYVALKKQLKKLQKETDKALEIINKHYNNSDNRIVRIGYNHDSYTDKYIDECLKQIERFEIDQLCKNKPKFDFTYLENDIILATIDGESVDEIVKNALTKYRK